MLTIRPVQAADLPAIYDICVRTAAAGGDARGHYTTDVLMGDLFAGPYVHLEPQLAFVLADTAPSRSAPGGTSRSDAGRAVGYVVGTADTATFVRRYRDEWIPRLGDRYPVPPPPPLPRDPEQEMHALHHHPERMLVPGLDGYPAHLHIDLLPDYQRRGHGRRLIERFLSVVPAPGVHVAMVTANVGARPFYDRLGFVELPVSDPGPLTYLGARTGRR
ncbi:putative GCN5-related N-acetyltransferase [Actinoplanes missouriensis 431]|uniref:Putative GCN5-related N-acetyltransferase n=1 Tax=Actinoplanes missouriensis (strain ATCC 14538 / DSM 43046 / CBS 188.64 / JCM 3121 / NBRC 102363 / NCIMB 12654 / NRRL B-3342 / UNCC 431) TaxID=512565 RepID=I0HAS0_ACTM4|nr:GNAT family N-acetyltransferase [Actinoplanes missouriensis]BAL90107.1 putative GCN5-related N-acetyltransferase [Actinoplanes missouriensis 431]